MTIGLPFSGKSTLAREYAANGWTVISRDVLLADIIRTSAFREEDARLKLQIHDPAMRFEARSDFVTQLLTIEIQRTVRENPSTQFFYDGTNLQKKTRAGILALGAEGVRVEGIYLQTPIEEILKRERAAHDSGERVGSFNEEGHKPEALLLMMHLSEEPRLDEGFASLEVRTWEGREPDRERQPPARR